MKPASNAIRDQNLEVVETRYYGLLREIELRVNATTRLLSRL